MAIELHHLNPSHDDEVARLKARIAELERMDTEHTLQIAKMNGYISYLEEERRWRKYIEEKPQDGQEVWAYDSSQKLVIKLEYQVREDCEGFVGFPIIHGFWPFITYWMPYNKPKAPEEEK